MQWSQHCANLIVLLFLSLAGCDAQLPEDNHDFDRRAQLKQAATAAVQNFKAPVVSVEQAETMLHMAEPPLIIDARSHEEYAISHLPNAILWHEDGGESMPRLLNDAGQNGRPVVFYCSIGYRSGAACEVFLKRYPNGNGVNMLGGLFLWAESGGEMIGSQLIHPYDAKWGQLLRPDLRWQPHMSPQPSKP